MSHPSILITGPTASGKTELAIRIAEELGGDIISVDARQCYRGMEIGTAAPSASQLSRAPHHNVGILDPFERDNAAAFRERATRWEEQIRQRGRRVIHCGGATLHLQSLIRPFDDIPRPDPIHVAMLEKEADEHGLAGLHQRLLSVDPVYARRMDGMNRQRIIRALDVWMQTGKPFSSHHTGDAAQAPPQGLLAFAIRHPREVLHRRIADRTRRMFQSGLREEVLNLMEQSERRRADTPPPTHDPLQTLGYEQMKAHLEGTISLEEAILATTIATRQYARRQMTWLRRWPFLRWIDTADPSDAGKTDAMDPSDAGGDEAADADRMLHAILGEVAANEQNPYLSK